MGNSYFVVKTMLPLLFLAKKLPHGCTAAKNCVHYLLRMDGRMDGGMDGCRDGGAIF